MKKLVTLGSMIVAFAVLFAISGCRKKTEPAAQPQTAIQTTVAVPTQATIPAVDTATEPQQIICPVMGGAINKETFTEYQGKKVYFCCPQCKSDFQKDPAKYISKLPQFAK
jgi:YHS domain-containing protein